MINLVGWIYPPLKKNIVSHKVDKSTLRIVCEMGKI